MKHGHPDDKRQDSDTPHQKTSIKAHGMTMYKHGVVQTFIKVLIAACIISGSISVVCISYVRWPYLSYKSLGVTIYTSTLRSANDLPHSKIGYIELTAVQREMNMSSITEDVLESFQAKLPKMLPNFQAPCWYGEVDPDIYTNGFDAKLRAYCNHRRTRERTTNASTVVKQKQRRLRCFPSFMVAGFAKCGTTDLHQFLTRMPGIYSASRKECNFWSSNRLGARFIWKCEPPEEITGKPSLDDYISLYDKSSLKIEQNTIAVNGTSFHPGILGDFTPITLSSLPYWYNIKGNEGLVEPRIISAHHLYSLRPQMKLIVMMRDPVSRAYSHFKFFWKYLKKKHSPEIFHEVIKTSVEELTSCAQRTSWRACAYQKVPHLKYDNFTLTMGMYVIYLKDWMEVFPKEQFLFIKAESYFEERRPVIQRVVRFLDIDLHIRGPFNDKKAIIHAKPMLQETKELLYRFYEPFNQQLAELLQDNNFLWRLN